MLEFARCNATVSCIAGREQQTPDTPSPPGRPCKAKHLGRINLMSRPVQKPDRLNGALWRANSFLDSSGSVSPVNAATRGHCPRGRRYDEDHIQVDNLDPKVLRDPGSGMLGS